VEAAPRDDRCSVAGRRAGPGDPAVPEIRAAVGRAAGLLGGKGPLEERSGFGAEAEATAACGAALRGFVLGGQQVADVSWHDVPGEALVHCSPVGQVGGRQAAAPTGG
jgi:hypothetical protein